jgi:hypothetical protein
MLSSHEQLKYIDNLGKDQRFRAVFRAAQRTQNETPLIINKLHVSSSADRRSGGPSLRCNPLKKLKTPKNILGRAWKSLDLQGIPVLRDAMPRRTFWLANDLTTPDSFACSP